MTSQETETVKTAKNRHRLSEIFASLDLLKHDSGTERQPVVYQPFQRERHAEIDTET